MDSKISIKYEPDEGKYNGIIKKEPYQSEGSFEIKTEPREVDCSYELDLYLDHQIKEEIVIGPTEFQKQEEIVIGPTEFQKQDTDSVSFKTVYPCTICSKSFKYKIALNKHNRTAHNNNTVVSYFFHKEKNNKTKNKNTCKYKHIKNDNNDFESITCGVCFKHFAALQHLKSHMKRCPMLKEKSSEVNCSIFGGEKKIIKENVVIKKEKVDDDMKIQERDLKKEVKYKDNTNLNEKAHNSKNKCPFCVKTFTFTNNLKRHIKYFHTLNSEIKIYSCDKCNKTFSRKDYLDSHKLSKKHSKSRVVVCKCGRQCRNKWSLKRHEEYYCVLNPSKPDKHLTCDVCNKSFSNKCSLNDHLKRHARAKTLICDFCKKIFPEKYLLIRHIQHHMEVPEVMYECEICGKKFIRSWSLKKHLISHTDRKPFSCKFCARGFKSRWGCLSHEKRVCRVPN